VSEKANLFVADLQKLTYADVEAFLGLDQSEDERPPEGVRLDYKADVPSDLGKDVAALANGAGGLLVIGVEAPGGRPQKAVGVSRKGRSELRTRLDNMTRATVQPTPRYSIGVCNVPAAAGAGPEAADASERQMAVVRVEPGVWPPHMYAQGDTRVIAVRSHDSSRAATLLEVEALFARRAEDAVSKATEAALDSAREWALTKSEDGKWVPGPSLELVVAPRLPTYLPLAQTVGKFWGAWNCEAQTERRADFTRICLTGEGAGIPLSTSWRVTAQGAIGWATNPVIRTVGQMDPVFALHQSAMALRWADALLAILGIEGTVMLRHGAVPDIARWDLQPFDHKVPGVHAGAHQPDQREMSRRETTWRRIIDSSEMASPGRLLVDIYTFHFREQASALVDSSEFSAYIETKVMPDAKPRSGR
jgi:hypothetical protein